MLFQSPLPSPYLPALLPSPSHPAHFLLLASLLPPLHLPMPFPSLLTSPHNHAPSPSHPAHFLLVVSLLPPLHLPVPFPSLLTSLFQPPSSPSVLFEPGPL